MWIGGLGRWFMTKVLAMQASKSAQLLTTHIKAMEAQPLKGRGRQMLRSFWPTGLPGDSEFQVQGEQLSERVR